MTNEEKYNGWTNHETWVTHLWLTNEEGIFRSVVAISSPHELELYVRENFGKIGVVSSGTFVGLSGEYSRDKIDRVNWQEIFDGLHEGEEE